MTEILPRDILLRCGGRTLHRTGFLAAMGAGRGYVEVKETFTRADGATPLATFVDRDVGAGGLVRVAAADKVRIEYPPALSGLVDAQGLPYCGPSLEGSRQQLGLRSRDFTVAPWSTDGSGTVVADQTAGPHGTVTADKFVESVGGTNHQVRQIWTITAGATVSTTFSVKAAERTIVRIFVIDDATQNIGCRVELNLVTGVASGGAGFNGGAFSSANVVKRANGFWRVTLRGSVGGAVTSVRSFVRLCQSAGVDNYAGDGASGVYIEDAQLEDKPFESSEIETAGAPVTRSADSLTLPINWGPFAISALIRWARPAHADAVGDIGLFPNAFVLGNRAANGSFESSFMKTTRDVSSEWWWTGANSISKLAGAIPAGNELIFAHQLQAPTTAPQVTLDVTGGGMLALSGVGTGLSKYGAQIVTIGSNVFAVLLDAIFVRGNRTRAELLAIP